MKIYLIVLAILVVGAFLTAVVMAVRTSHHDLASDPYSIEKIVKVDLPDIVSVESEDNMDRGASRWDCYRHHAKFAEELSPETILHLEKLCMTDSLHWRKNVENDSYIYSDEGGIDQLYSVSCVIYHDSSSVSYEVDETEGIFVFMPFAIGIMILILVGAVLSPFVYGNLYVGQRIT